MSWVVVARHRDEDLEMGTPLAYGPYDDVHQAQDRVMILLRKWPVVDQIELWPPDRCD